jgi:hypothetical protein
MKTGRAHEHWSHKNKFVMLAAGVEVSGQNPYTFEAGVHQCSTSAQFERSSDNALQ